MANESDHDLSYDPRSWAASARTAPPPPPAPSRPAPLRPASPRLAEPRQPWATLAVGAAIAVAGAGAAWSSRSPTGPEAIAPAVTRGLPGDVVESRTLIVPSAADLRASLLSAGIVPADAAAAGAAVAEAAVRKDGRGTGDLRLDLVMAPAAIGTRLRRLALTGEDGAGVLLVARADGGYAATPLAAHLVRRLAFVRGELDGESFYSSAVAAGVADVLVGDFANAFRYDFDMQREVAPGDVFEVGFAQRVNAQGDSVGLPTLVYAALSTTAKSRALYRSDSGEWFDAGGRSSRRALMRTPVEAARISSGFGMRGHPILGFIKMHRGTDFAAPTGTPVFAAGDATVAFAGPKGPNGNFVRLHHDNGWDTLYLHLDRIAGGLAPGMRVAQGQPIGEVGTTGRSTGPHLHYEVHIAGEPVDPLSIDTAGGRTLSGAALAAFRKLRDRTDAARAAAG